MEIKTIDCKIKPLPLSETSQVLTMRVQEHPVVNAAAKQLGFGVGHITFTFLRLGNLCGESVKVVLSFNIQLE